MSRYCVVVADGARARFFSLEEADIGESGPNLVEHDVLVNPEAESAGKDIYSNDKSGRNAAPMGAGAHGYDDHRDSHSDELEHRFAKKVAHEAVTAASQRQATRLVVVADKRMMGHLRSVIVVPPTAGFRVSELAKDLSKLSLTELHAHLASDGMVPPREPGI